MKFEYWMFEFHGGAVGHVAKPILVWDAADGDGLRRAYP
jgi:hypothetical protein